MEPLLGQADTIGILKFMLEGARVFFFVSKSRIAVRVYRAGIVDPPFVVGNGQPRCRNPTTFSGNNLAEHNP